MKTLIGFISLLFVYILLFDLRISFFAYNLLRFHFFILNMVYTSVLALATSIYFYELSGQSENVLDLTNSLYTRDYVFLEVYLIAAVAEDGEDHPTVCRVGSAALKRLLSLACCLP